MDSRLVEPCSPIDSFDICTYFGFPSNCSFEIIHLALNTGRCLHKTADGHEYSVVIILDDAGHGNGAHSIGEVGKYYVEQVVPARRGLNVLLQPKAGTQILLFLPFNTGAVRVMTLRLLVDFSISNE